MDGSVTQRMNASKVRQDWSQLINRVFRKEARIIVEKSGIPVAAIISIEDLERLTRHERETLENPDEVRRSRDDPNTVKLHYMRYTAPPSGKMVCVIVKSLESDAFILTAYQTYRIIEGELIWRKES